MRIEFTTKSEVNWKCTLCKGEISNLVLSFVEAPYILGVSKNDILADKAISYQIGQCINCGLLQHGNVISKEMYSEIHSHAVGGIWERHFEKFVEFIRASAAAEFFEKVECLEIGPSVSPVLRRLNFKGSRSTFVDFMDDCPFQLRSNETYKAGYFPHQEIANTKFDIIIASHVIEHATSLDSFIENLMASISQSGEIYLSFPNFKSWISNGFWNAFSLEHVNYLGVEQFDYLKKKYRIDIEIGHFNDHSIFAKIRKAQSSGSEVISGNFAKIDSISGPWLADINGFLQTVSRSLRENSDLDVIVAGASHLAQYILSLDENVNRRTKFIVDNANEKQGKRLYGTSKIVYSFENLKSLKSGIVIVPPSPYRDEMKTQVSRLNEYLKII